MTLSIGDRMRKCDKETGEPIPSEREGYTDYEIVDLSPTWQETTPAPPPAEGEESAGRTVETVVMVKLRKKA